MVPTQCAASCFRASPCSAAAFCFLFIMYHVSIKGPRGVVARFWQSEGVVVAKWPGNMTIPAARGFPHFGFSHVE